MSIYMPSTSNAPSWNVGRQIRLIVLGFIVIRWWIKDRKIIFILYIYNRCTNRNQSQLKREIWKPPLASIMRKKTHRSFQNRLEKSIHYWWNLYSNTDRHCINVIIINIAKNMQRTAFRMRSYCAVSNFSFGIHFACAKFPKYNMYFKFVFDKFRRTVNILKSSIELLINYFRRIPTCTKINSSTSPELYIQK